MTMNWRGGVLRSFSILCRHGRAVMEEPSTFTLQTVSVSLVHNCLSAHKKKILSKLFLSFSWGNFQPQSIVKSLVPSLNTLVLFEVSPVSFHQVRRTAPAFHHSCAFVYRPLTWCVCQGLRGFHRRQVSFVSERLVSRAIFRTSSTLRRGLHPTEPALTKRRKPDTIFSKEAKRHILRFIVGIQVHLPASKTFLMLVISIFSSNFQFPECQNSSWCFCWLVCLCAAQETVLLEWVNPIYLDISYQEQIQEEFEDSSEIQLKDFLMVRFSFC